MKEARTLSGELVALTSIVETILTLTDEERERVIVYIVDRFGQQGALYIGRRAPEPTPMPED